LRKQIVWPHSFRILVGADPPADSDPHARFLKIAGAESACLDGNAHGSWKLLFES
jgi:hypothetical protein